ncbi:MAG: hybrid sensor histidine kinase/response regulator [Gemmatimonadota bacterium]
MNNDAPFHGAPSTGYRAGSSSDLRVEPTSAELLGIRRKIVIAQALLTAFVGWGLGVAGSLNWFPMNEAQMRFVLMSYLWMVPLVGAIVAIGLPLYWYRPAERTIRSIVAGEDPPRGECAAGLARALKLPLWTAGSIFAGAVGGYAIGTILLRVITHLPYLEILKTALQAPMIGLLYGLVSFFILERILRPAVRELANRVPELEPSVPRLPLFFKLLAGTVAIVALACLSLLFSVLSHVQRSEENQLGRELSQTVLRAAVTSPVSTPTDGPIPTTLGSDFLRWLNRGAYAFAVSTDGKILTTHPEGYTNLFQEQLHDPAPIFRSGAGYFVDRVGRHRLVAHAPLPTPSRRLVAILPLDEALVETRSLWRIGTWLVLISMAVSAAFGMLFASHISEPVRFLTATAREVTEQGDLSIRSSLRTTDEIGDLSRAFDQMTSKIEQAQDAAIRREKLAALGQLLSGTAHELNNPLAAILMNAQLLEHEDLPQSVHAIAHTIGTESRRAAKIVGNLLSFARPRPPERQSVALNEVVRKAVDFHRYEMAIDGTELVEHYEEALPPVFCDPDQIQQVTLNLLANARHALHGRRKARLSVATHRAGATAEFVVEDTGPGIAPEVRRHIFDPFFTTRSDRGGTGLGLFIVHQIVKEHGGEIRVDGELGVGTRVTVRLPLGPAPTPPRGVTPPAGAPQPRGELSVLLVDDEIAIASSAAQYLERLGYRSRAVASGREAWSLLQRESFDVIVADFRLPDLSGHVLYEMLRKSRPHLADRMLFMTGDTVSEETRSTLVETRRPFLEKPFNLERLREAIDEVAAEPADGNAGPAPRPNGP